MVREMEKEEKTDDDDNEYPSVSYCAQFSFTENNLKCMFGIKELNNK
jgi:hypothetical protein